MFSQINLNLSSRSQCQFANKKAKWLIRNYRPKCSTPDIIQRHLRHQQRMTPSTSIERRDHYRLFITKITFSALDGFRLFLFLVITSPAVENRRSVGTDVAGIHKYRRATVAAAGNRFSCSCHHRNGDWLCSSGCSAQYASSSWRMDSGIN